LFDFQRRLMLWLNSSDTFPFSTFSPFPASPCAFIPLLSLSPYICDAPSKAGDWRKNVFPFDASHPLPMRSNPLFPNGFRPHKKSLIWRKIVVD
jgi:hypothetical protein